MNEQPTNVVAAGVRREDLATSDAAWIKLSLLAQGITTDGTFDAWFSDTRGFARRRNFYNSPVWETGRVGSLPQEIRLGPVVVAVNAYGSSPWTLTTYAGDQGPEPWISNEQRSMRFPVEMVTDLASLHDDPELAQVCNLYGGSALSFFSPRSCYFFSDDTECRFCSLAGTADETDFANRLTPQQIRAAVTAVVSREADRINQVMIVGGNERNLDRGFTNHLKLVRAASTALRELDCDEAISVHLATMPPRDLDLIDELADVGNVHVMFNLEVWDGQRFGHIAPGKAKDYGRGRIIAALHRLRAAVGDYRAHSILIAGLEPPESTVVGSRALADIGVSPIINAYHSDKHSRLGLKIRPTYRQLTAVARGLQQLYEAYPIQPYWKGCGRNALDFEASRGMFRGDIPNLG